MSACGGGYLLIQNTICVWGVTWRALGVHVHCLCAHPCRTQNLLMFIVHAWEIANCVRTKPFTSQYSPCITHTPFNPFLSLFTPFPLFYLCLFSFSKLSVPLLVSLFNLLSYLWNILHVTVDCEFNFIYSCCILPYFKSRHIFAVIVEAVYRTICFKKWNLQAPISIFLTAKMTVIFTYRCRF